MDYRMQMQKFLLALLQTSLGLDCICQHEPLLCDISIQQDKSCPPQLGQMFEVLLKYIFQACEVQWYSVLSSFQCL